MLSAILNVWPITLALFAAFLLLVVVCFAVANMSGVCSEEERDGS